MRFLPGVPQEVRLGFARGAYRGAYRGIDDAKVYAAAVRMVSDDRMIECWNTLRARADPDFRDANGGWAESFIATSIFQYAEASRSSRNWMNLSRDKQAEWREKFDLAVEHLDELLRVGPWPEGLMDKLAFKKDYDRLHGSAVNHRDIEHVEGDQEDPPPYGENDLESLPIEDPYFWGMPFYEFRHVLDALARAQFAAADEYRQTLKKPNDKSAGRIRFLQGMTNWCNEVCGQKLQKIVATTGEVVFNDPGINVRLVQTHTGVE